MRGYTHKHRSPQTQKEASDLLGLEVQAAVHCPAREPGTSSGSGSPGRARCGGVVLAAKESRELLRENLDVSHFLQEGSLAI